MTLGRRALLAGAGFALAAGALPRRAGAEEPASIALWGDSLTFGTGADTVAGKYANRLGRSFTPPRAVFNGGIGGQTSTQIAARMLADEAHRDAVAVLWAGRNNYWAGDTVLADVEAMVAHLRGDRCLVLSVPNAGLVEEYRGAQRYAAIATLNAALRTRFTTRLIDIRAVLIETGLASLGLEPTGQDLVDIGHDVPPRSLRADHVHLNDKGQAVVAKAVHDAILSQGW